MAERQAPEVTHLCSECRRTFMSPSGLWRHKQAVHQGIRYPCYRCSKVYCRSEDRNKHQVQCWKDKDYLATKLPGQFVLPVQTTPSPRVVPACQCQQPRTVEISTQTDPMVLTEEFALDVTERCTEEDIVGAQSILFPDDVLDKVEKE